MTTAEDRWKELVGTKLIPECKFEGAISGKGSVEIIAEGFLFLTFSLGSGKLIIDGSAVQEIQLVDGYRSEGVTFFCDPLKASWPPSIVLSKKQLSRVSPSRLEEINGLLAILKPMFEGEQVEREAESESKSKVPGLKVFPARSIENATYLGGLSSGPKPEIKGDLVFNAARISIGTLTIPTSDIAKVLFEGGQVAKRKIAATMVFGAVGALAAKGSAFETVIEVVLKSGESAFFHIRKQAPYAVRAELTPALSAMGLTSSVLEDDKGTEETAESAELAPSSLVEQIKELAKLRDEGILTDEEFTTAKAKLLS